MSTKKKSQKKITKDDLIKMAKDSDMLALRIEDEYKTAIERIEAVPHTTQELAKLLAEEERIYLGKKADLDRQTKRELEGIQKTLLDEVKSQYMAEQMAIMREYAIFESKAKETYKQKEVDYLREYSTKVDTLISKYNKKLHVAKLQYAIPRFEPPTIEHIIKTAKIQPCAELKKIDDEFATNKKRLKEEYNKTKESWNIDAQIYSTQKELDVEYNARCTRYRYKINIERFYHVNVCAECKTDQFSYIPVFDPKNKESVAKVRPLTAYFRNTVGSSAIDATAATLVPTGIPEVDAILAEFARQFVHVFVDFYNKEIVRIRDYEISVPKEQNVVYTVLFAEKIWTKVKSTKILDLKFGNKSDDEKVADFRKQEDKFYKDFPIVARYMVCADTYNRVAFKKYLVKLIANNAKQTAKSRAGLSKEGEAEDKWIELQADYVKYLYQEYHKSKHLSQAELRNVWKETYDLLKKEFGDFRELYDKKVKQVEEEKKIHNAEVAKEVIGRLTTIQSIDEDTQYKLYLEMQNTLYLQRANKNLKALAARLPKTEAGLDGRGRNVNAGEQMDRDKKVKEAKAKTQPEAQIKNPVKHYYDNRETQADTLVFRALRDLCTLHKYHDVQHELAAAVQRYRVDSAIEGDGINATLLEKWEDERKKWRKERATSANPDIKIHIPYTRNLVQMYYDNGCRFEM
jgi:hypothetical protein